MLEWRANDDSKHLCLRTHNGCMERLQLDLRLNRQAQVLVVKYVVGSTEYALATTLLDTRRYRVRDLADLHHGRWNIEEMYKISKNMLRVEQSHGQSERAVKQELYAHFT